MAASIDCSSSDRFAVDFVNEQFQNDMKKLKTVKELYETYREKKKTLENQLSLASSEVPNEIEHAISDAEGAKNKVKQLGKKKEKLTKSLQDQHKLVLSMLFETEDLTQQVAKLEKLSKYLSCVVFIDELSTRIQTLLLTDSLSEGVDSFMQLSSLCSLLQKSCCHNLVTYTRDTTLFWYKILKNKLASDFEDVLKQLRWPLVSSTIKMPQLQNPGEARARMEQLFKHLLQLQLPDPLQASVDGPHPLLSNIAGLRSPILPLQLMIRPLRKRFKFHFYGNKQTNDIGKPEWYFTQILTWIRDHSDFLTQRIQPLLKEAGKADIDCKLEFMRGLVMLVLEKIVHDLPELMADEHQFSHLVDEALLLDRELRHAYGYPLQCPASLHVLAQGRAFSKWLHIEKKFALEKIDAMMSSPTAWESQYRNIVDVDEMKVPECGESFMTLMLTITDRYKPLPVTSAKLQFLELQQELLEDFRVRLVQVKDNTLNPLSPRYTAILNTAHYIAEVLREWSELVFFLQLQYYKMENKENEMSEGCEIPFGYTTVFEDVIELYERLRGDMLKVIVSHVFTDVKARSKPYKDDRWISLPYQKDVTLGLSVSACEMLLVLKDHLLEVAEAISKPLFNTFWEKMAEQLNIFLFEEVVLRNKFNPGGAAQLQFDMTRNLFPLFGEFTPKPDSYFREMKESCMLLNLNMGSAMLLKDVLKEALHTARNDPDKLAEAKTALQDVGINKLVPEEAEMVLNLRTDLVT